MVQSNTNIDYVHTSFQYPVLTKVHDMPTYELLKNIKDEVKANATNVQCDLGGGRHGHLGLVLTPVKYALIVATPYVWNLHPWILVIPPNTTLGRVKIMRDAYDKEHQAFKEMIDLEKNLVTQLVQAIPAPYMK